MILSKLLIILCLLGGLVGVVCISGCWSMRYRPNRYTMIMPRGICLRDIPIWVDRDFSVADKMEITRAVGTWNYVMNGWVHLNIVDRNFNMEVDKIQQSEKESGWLFMKIDSNSKLVPQMTTGRAIAFVNRIGGNHLYMIRDRMFDAEMYGTALHEMGHLLGSPHVGEGLMSSYYDRWRFSCVDLVTVEMVAQHFGVAVGGMNYCFDDRVGVRG